MNLTLEEIDRRVKYIKLIKDDAEMAHSEEDALYLDFIKQISKRKDALGHQARRVLKASKINFARWYA